MKHRFNKYRFYIYAVFAVMLSAILFTVNQSCKKIEIERIVKVETGGISDITSNSAVVSGNIIDAGEKGISQHGHCWAPYSNPDIDQDARTELGSRNNLGSFNSNITDIAPGTTYYIRAYATSYGVTTYGINVSFTTNEASLPVVTTKLPENITTNSATCGGNVTDDGGDPVTERGVCWNTSENPTLDNNEGFTNDGSGMGEFPSNLTGLSVNTTYYVRAYATNAAGTAYGDELSFATQDVVSIIWNKTFGGSNWEWAWCVQQTIDNGYIFAGGSNSNDGDVSGNHGGFDYWIAKLTSAGELDWQKSYGGSILDVGWPIIQTADGGYLTAGYSYSEDGDVSGQHGNSDCWIVKINSSGEITWQKSLGGSNIDAAYSILQSTDGDYIIAGHSMSNDGDVTVNHGDRDYWIVKLTSAGEIDRQKSLGGSGNDYITSVEQTTDGGYIIAGRSSSNDGDVSGNHGNYDYWIVKLTSAWEIDWQKSLGGSGSDIANSIKQTNDGGYIIAGESMSGDGDISGHHGDTTDYWIVKLSSSGEIDWQKSLGGSNADVAYSVQQTTDGGYIIAGRSSSNDGDVSGNHGDLDFWIVKLTSAGEIDWQKSLGGSYDDEAFSIQQTTDGGYIIGGETLSDDGDVPGNKGGEEAWIIKLVEN